MVFGGQFDVEGKTVVITGGSQGLGAEVAIQCFRKGANVVIIARTESNLIKTKERVESVRVNKLQTVEYRAVDLSEYEETESALQGISPDVVFFCAGASIPKLFTDLTPTELKQGIDINLRTSTNVSHIVMKKVLVDKKDYTRHFIFCSSILAVFPFVGYGQYAPSKAGVRALADILRQEGGPFGLKVHTVFAGNFESEGYTKEEETKPEITKTIEGPSSAITVEQCAQKIIWYVDHGYETVFTDTIGWILYSGMLGFSPRFLGLLQPFVALLLAIITPIYMIFVRRDVEKYYNKKK